ncbi:hypothetical protein [Sporomusa sp.]|jgi:hypothetical protein|uniref:hypothetical protein n=1 Tax=Sporomusa sp. TaxID=2078658 RepID=UPI002BEB8A9A|nr:hypothetical protein [Sporomusa sp.]MDF2873581.1 hypothetical protein [Sporomusa sp.]HWR05771.1 hypothetical protein [Sporomusa sp.]
MDLGITMPDDELWYNLPRFIVKKEMFDMGDKSPKNKEKKKKKAEKKVAPASVINKTE